MRIRKYLLTFVAAGAFAATAPPGFAEEGVEAEPQDATETPATPEAQAAEAAVPEAEAAGEKLEPRLPLNELRIFAEAFSRVGGAYVEEIDDRTLLENAIRGMLAELDPHSAYLDKEAFADLQEATTGNYGGLGLEVGMEDGFVKVISPMDDTPASAAGLESGDLIIKLDQVPVKGMSLPEAIKAMRGEPGSDITVTVVKSGASTPDDITLTREIIKVASVRHRMLDDGYGYIRIAQFQNRTGSEVEDALRELSADGPLSGLVLDVRNNPGGVLQSAVEVSDLFVEDGLIVYTSGRLANAELRYSAARPDQAKGVPVVVLVNEGTASASEIVAGALQDHGRAVVMGTSTFGKGSVQTILPLNNEKAIKLTTARYYTPNGNSIQAEGITPDIWVDRSKVTPVKSSPWRVKEKDLPGHLSASEGAASEGVASDGAASEKEGAASEGATSEKKRKDAGERQGNMDLAVKDYQLNEALTLLKGFSVLARSREPQG